MPTDRSPRLLVGLPFVTSTGDTVRLETQDFEVPLGDLVDRLIGLAKLASDAMNVRFVEDGDGEYSSYRWCAKLVYDRYETADEVESRLADDERRRATKLKAAETRKKRAAGLRDLRAMSFNAVEVQAHVLKGGWSDCCYAVIENPKTCGDFEWAVGKLMTVNGDRYSCVAVERFAHLGPWKAGERIGLILRPVKS